MPATIDRLTAAQPHQLPSEAAALREQIARLDRQLASYLPARPENSYRPSGTRAIMYERVMPEDGPEPIAYAAALSAELAVEVTVACQPATAAT
jgi:hypothetical protein